MIRTRDSIANPVTGETVTFQRTSADSDSEVVIAEVTLEPGGSVPGVHVHPSQTETFEILDGAVGFRLGRGRRAATTGETVVVKAGTAHAVWNAGDGQARFLCEIRPALGFERLLETMFALARDGKTDHRGVPHPLRLAAIADRDRRMGTGRARPHLRRPTTVCWRRKHQPRRDSAGQDQRRPASGGNLRTIHPQRTAS